MYSKKVVMVSMLLAKLAIYTIGSCYRELTIELNGSTIGKHPNLQLHKNSFEFFVMDRYRFGWLTRTLP